MIIHLRQMPEGILHLEGSESAAPLGLEEADARPLGELTYSLAAGLSDGGLWVHGRLRLPVELTCVGCLERFAARVDVPEFALQIPLEGKESVDLTEWVREDIFLALPPYPKCDAGSTTPCPAAQFTRGSGPAESPASAADPPGSPFWDVLDQLKQPKQ